MTHEEKLNKMKIFKLYRAIFIFYILIEEKPKC